MDLSEFLIRVVFLFTPGYTSRFIYRKIRGSVSRKDWEDYLEIAAFSLISYILAGFSLYLFRKVHWLNDGKSPFLALRAIYDKNLSVDRTVIWEIVLATVIAAIVAVIASYVEQYKLIHKLARWIKATKRYGDEDVWDYFNQSPTVKWVYVRDHKYDLVYYGWIQAFSDPYKERELILRDVEVFRNSTFARLYRSDLIYLSRKSDELTIEIDLVFNYESQVPESAMIEETGVTQLVN